VDIFLDDRGEVDHALFQVPELRGFEKFCEGRPAEDMPQITSRICGVCPTAHHMASTKALDALYKVAPPPAARKIRELVYNAFIAEDHALHFFFLGGPDFIVGPAAPAGERNVLGVIGKLGREAGLKVIGMRRRLREITALAGGKAIHPVLGLPGGVARPIRPAEQEQFKGVAAEAVDFALFTLEAFEEIVLKNSEYLEMILSETYRHRTYYLALVDDRNSLSFYDGPVRVVSPDGVETARFGADQYAAHIAERAEPWSYMKLCYLREIGWRGFVEGADSGIYSVAPLARLNVADTMPTPLAQEAYLKFCATLGPKPVHNTLANHWARIIELLCAAERLRELADDPELTSPDIRTVPEAIPTEGIGVVEAPRGTLFHHYITDERGLIRKANLIVATQNNAARIAMSVEKAARRYVRDGQVEDGVLNMVEIALRAYDPCLGCATHSGPGSMPLVVRILDHNGRVLTHLQRDSNGISRTHY
jgi:F420-non-reducing hydrogenase large subunit